MYKKDLPERNCECVVKDRFGNKQVADYSVAKGIFYTLIPYVELKNVVWNLELPLDPDIDEEISGL